MIFVSPYQTSEPPAMRRGEAGLQLAVGSHGTLVMCLASFGPSEDNLSQYSLGFGRQFYRKKNHGF